MVEFKKYKLKTQTAQHGANATFRLQMAAVILAVSYYDGVNAELFLSNAAAYDFVNNPIKDQTEVLRRLLLHNSAFAQLPLSALTNVDLTDIEFPEGSYTFTQPGAVTMTLHYLEAIN